MVVFHELFLYCMLRLLFKLNASHSLIFVSGQDLPGTYIVVANLEASYMIFNLVFALFSPQPPVPSTFGTFQCRVS